MDADDPPEAWLPAPGWSGLYEVSSLGAVRSIDRVVEQRNGPRRYRGRILRQTSRTCRPSGGRVHRMHWVSLSRQGERPASALVADLVAEAFHGPRPENHSLRWRNGKTQDSRAANLSYQRPRRATGGRR